MADHGKPEVHKRAVESLFDVIENMCEGAVSVDRQARIVWINDKYRSLLDVGEQDDVLGCDIEDVIPESLMRSVIETGQPIPVDIMRFQENYFVVSRLPLHGDSGDVIGAVGFVLYDNLDYLKPLISKFEGLQSRLSSAEKELARTRRTRYGLSHIVGNSTQMVEIRRQARRVAQAQSPVLLLGETGTGKELLAQSIHALSARAEGPFVAVNMGAVPENLLEAEFFGTAPGAYTGADRRGRRGKFELADGGTLFLDEIADMPVQLQVKLLRALEEKVIEPVGSNDLRPVDVRILAATSQDIDAKVKDGTFRKYLYYRLNVLQIEIPPLRERVVDLRSLSEVLLEQIAFSGGGPAKELDASGLLALQEYAWPGNVREMRNVLERAAMDTDETVLTAPAIRKFLPEGQDRIQTEAETAPSRMMPYDIEPLAERVAQVEREAIADALRATSGKKAPAARLLGMSRSTLYEKLEEYGLS